MEELESLTIVALKEIRVELEKSAVFIFAPAVKYKISPDSKLAWLVGKLDKAETDLVG